VLGSFPGVASLAAQQYYAHPRNQFWPILARCGAADLAPALRAAPGRGARARPGHLGRLRRCRREGSLDSAIEDAEPNDLAAWWRRCPGCAAVAHNGGESARAMRVTRALGLPVLRLPSTSPANASWSLRTQAARPGARPSRPGWLA
jgi:hypoxanthine-DNA glycosylase